MRCKPFLHELRALLVATATLTGMASGAEAAVVEGTEASFNWADAAGPVAGYNVFVTRNGAASPTPEMAVTTSNATVASSIGDSIAVQVAAFDGAGNQGPLSPPSELVLFAAAPPPPPPAQVVVESTGDLSIQEALATAQAGEQVVAQLRSSSTKLFFDAAAPASQDPDEAWGLDQLVVGAPTEPTVVRLVDAIGMAQLGAPLGDLPEVTLFGLGAGPPCARDGEPGLILHPGSRLVLGGIDLYAFDGDRCVYVNELFASSPDPNRIAWGAGEVVLHGDLEEDGVLDPDDNCLLVANPDQCDGDRDGFGNSCDFDVTGDLVSSVDDLNEVFVLARQLHPSRDPVFDINCDGAVGLDDVSAILDHQNEPVGPSGLACAADATCFQP